MGIEIFNVSFMFKVNSNESPMIVIFMNWNKNNLDSFLLNPKKWVPGTKMVFVGIKNGQERANVIKYLQILN